jgi:NAD-dependent SIR2 family protein deacetylase
MKTEDIKKELGSKERTLIDLHRYITTRTDLNPNYFLMLGAGCSISSGIKTGKDLIAGWRKEVFFEHEENSGKKYDENEAIRFLTAKCGNWYNQSNEYSSLFEKKYDLPRQRRMFVEQQVSEAQPSLGYAYLSSLVQGSYFNTIFTSNFDDLLNESFYQFTNSRPIVCAHDSSISSVTVTSKRPK